MRMKGISVIHQAPGRLRLRIPRHSFPLLVPDATESKTSPVAAPRTPALQELQALDGVLTLRFNPRCASLVLCHDPRRLSREQLLDRVQALLLPRPKHREAAAASCSAGTPCACPPGKTASVAREFRRFAWLSAVVGVVFVRRTLLGAVVRQSLFSPLGLVVLGASLPMARRGVRDLKQGRPTLDSFLAGGVVASVVGGQALTALEILWINSGADLLSAWIAERSRKHIAEILELTSHHTFVLQGGVEVEREVASLRPGEVVVLHTGEKVCVDGVVVHGEALVDESSMTGRPDSVHKRLGDAVFAGTFVREGVIRVRAEKVGDSTYLNRVLYKVQDALETRAPIEGVADRLAARLVKLGFVATGATLLLTGSWWRAYTVLLVMACPCATVLAASTAVSAAMNAAARRRILIKGGRYLEELGACSTIFFDKTGTLTTTRPRLAAAATGQGSGGADSAEAVELLALAASAETHNHHPLARAILAEARRHGIAPSPHGECDYHMGQGMRATINGYEILVGNAKLARHYDASTAPLEPEAQRFQAQGLTVLYVFKDRELQGLLGFATETRPEAGRVLGQLRRLGVQRIMLVTGDEEASAGQLVRELGLDGHFASAMPEEKADLVEEAAATYGPVLMVGDGINDALALTRAHVGVAFGTGGSEVAVEASDIALAEDNLESLPALYALSRKTIQVAHQNFWLATGSNVVGVVLGALGLLSPVSAGLVHVVHSLGVLANSSRLLRLPQAPAAPDNLSTGDTHGFRNPGKTAPLSEDQASHSRPHPDQL